VGGLTGRAHCKQLESGRADCIEIIGLGFGIGGGVYFLATRVFHSKNALAYALVSPAAVGLAVFCCIRSSSTSPLPFPTGSWQPSKIHRSGWTMAFKTLHASLPIRC